MSFQKYISILAVPALLALSAPAFAQDNECSTDADCDAGSACEKGQYTNGCEAGAECDSAVYETETGWCVVQPVECAADSDCGEYSSCQAVDQGSCWASSDGTSGCDPVDPNAPKYCAPAQVECEADADCPREFECVTFDSGACPDIACAEGSSCEAPACEVTTTSSCRPKHIECEMDSQCPTDWACGGTTAYECSGGGSTVNPGAPAVDDPAGGTEPAPEPEPMPDGDAAIAPEETCTEIQIVGACAPAGWADFGIGTVENDLASGGEVTSDDGDSKAAGEEASDADASDPDAGGGCSVSPRGARSGGGAWMLLLGLPLLFRRRGALGARR